MSSLSVLSTRTYWRPAQLSTSRAGTRSGLRATMEGVSLERGPGESEYEKGDFTGPSRAAPSRRSVGRRESAPRVCAASLRRETYPSGSALDGSPRIASVWAAR